ncbi:MAG: hypothetical protein E7603_04760 [Ruminococcaceae bacterium]|nr:hypothetical protein [Oscillospiraceae bacterium]
MSLSQAYRNKSYLFVPFSFLDTEKFENFINGLEKSCRWLPATDKNDYLFKYVTDKLMSEKRKDRQCFHFIANESAANECGVFFDNNTFYQTTARQADGKKTPFSFLISDIHLHCFGTSVCILTFGLEFEKSDPAYIASAQYHLRKIYQERIHSPESGESFTFLELAKRFMLHMQKGFTLDFFFYTNPSTERANFFTYLETPKKDSYDRELYYLKWCYNDTFVYDEETDRSGSENYKASADTIWGISPSASVCLVSPNDQNQKFLNNTFFPNFKNQYLFMYILLLHQKYEMYLLLTKIGVGMNNNLKELEKYHDDLCEFETDFVFSNITEVPQYQRLYEKTARIFALADMFKDIREPLTALEERRRKKSDEKMNSVLTMLSLLSIASILMDAFGLIENFSSIHTNTIPVIVTKICFCVVMVAVATFLLIKNARNK